MQQRKNNYFDVLDAYFIHVFLSLFKMQQIYVRCFYNEIEKIKRY